MKKFKMTDEGAQRLSSEIVQQAVIDYKRAIRRGAYLVARNPAKWRSELDIVRGAMVALERFFKSDWCYALSGVEQKVWVDVIARLKKEEGYDDKVVSQELGKN